eukprot:36841-Prymnesium_polylepis.1
MVRPHTRRARPNRASHPNTGRANTQHRLRPTRSRQAYIDCIRTVRVAKRESRAAPMRRAVLCVPLRPPGRRSPTAHTLAPSRLPLTRTFPHTSPPPSRTARGARLPRRRAVPPAVGRRS